MLSERNLLLVAVLMVLPLSGCTPSAKDSTAEPSETVPEDSILRDPNGSILGNVGADGLCIPSIVDIDHQRNTAQVRYNGQPGDKISVNFLKDDGSVDRESFELGGTNTSWIVPTSIYNGDLDSIKVEGSGRVGRRGSCTIPVS